MSGGPSAGIASGHCPTGVDGPLSISNAPQVVANHKATRISVPICGMSPASAASSASAAMIANRAKRPSAAKSLRHRIARGVAACEVGEDRHNRNCQQERDERENHADGRAPLDVDWLRAMAFVLR